MKECPTACRYHADEEPVQATDDAFAFTDDAMGNATYKDNFVKVEKFIMVKALEDEMVEPKEGEHWEFVDSTGVVVPMKDSFLYKEDTFGLQTVDKAGKLVFETTAGDHLQFSKDELF